MNSFTLNEVHKVEILTLEDNYIDRLSGDNSAIVTRATAGKDLTCSVLAEFGFSVLVTTTAQENTKTMIFDFGLSRDVAARNADTLNIDLTRVEAASVSHGHIDHVGGLTEVAKRIGKKGLELVVHPAAFRPNRYRLLPSGVKIQMPPLERAKIEDAGLNIVETQEPYSLLGGDVLFLGEIPKRTRFEKGMQDAYYEENEHEIHDTIEDDTSLVMNIHGKGLVILTGCAHAGIVNTVEYAREVTGIHNVHAIVGGFHLTGPAFEPFIDDTVTSIKEIGPDYIVPTHCTGKKAMNAFEQAMPGQFMLNMSGTKLTFAA